MNPPKILLVSLLIVQVVEKSMGKRTHPFFFYDMFGDRTHLIYNGGQAVSVCLGDRSPCDAEATVQLVDPRGKVVHSRACNDNANAYWTIPIDDGFEGTYICRYKRHSVTVDTETIEMAYRTCDPLLGCQGEPSSDCPSTPTFCIVTSFQENRACGPIPIRACQVHEPIRSSSLDYRRELFCPVHADSLCHAMAKNYSRAWAGMQHPPTYRNASGIYDTNVSCSDTTVPRVQYASQFRPYYDAILLNETEKVISFVYKNNKQLDGSNLSCHIKTKDGKVVDQHFVQTRNVVNLQLNDALFNNGCNVFKMNCSFIDAVTYKGWAFSMTSNYLIAMGGHLSIKRDTESDNPDANHTLHCNLRPAPADVNFVVSYYWTMENSNEPLKGQNITVPLRGWYQCHATIEYSWCAPRHYFKRIIDSERLELYTTTTSVATTAKTTSTLLTYVITTTMATATTTLTSALTTTIATATTTLTSVVTTTMATATTTLTSVVTTVKATSTPTSSTQGLTEKGMWKWKWAIGYVLLKMIGPALYMHLD